MVTAIEEELNQNYRLSNFQVFNRMLVAPGHFFQEDLSSIDSVRGLRFLIMSSLFLTLAKASLLQQAFLRMSLITFLNALVMPFISALIGYVLIEMVLGKGIGFKRLFTVYALSSGLTMLVAWIPLFIFITEPWKWFLIGLGLVKECGLSRKQSLFVIGLSILLLILGFWLVNEAVLLFR